jgi:hypothetical protein
MKTEILLSSTKHLANNASDLPVFRRTSIDARILAHTKFSIFVSATAKDPYR